MKRKVLITGVNGQLGRAVKERFAEDELICTDVDELDITNLDSVQKFVGNVKPDLIINCAAYTAVDKAEENVEEEKAVRLNTYGPENLAIAASKNDSMIVHISTDYVFGGKFDTDMIYYENDVKDPTTVYGRTKLAGEKSIMKHTTRYYIFRTAWLFGDGPNFVRTMLKLGKENEEVKVVYDQYGSPTYAADLADIIYQALEKKIPLGIYHATNIGFTTWYDFVKEIFKQAGVNCRVIPVTSAEFVRPAARPKNSMLSKAKLLEEGVEIFSWENALQRYLANELK